MAKFIIRFFIFSLPVLVVFLVPAFILLQSGENFHDVDHVLNSKQPLLIGYAYNSTNYNYIKWKSLQSNPAFDTWALGSSRVLQFRDQMFQSRFYNAGFTIEGVGDFLPFLRSIDKIKYPKYLIIGLDHWMFNPAWAKLNEKKEVVPWKEDFHYFAEYITYKKVYTDLLDGKYSFGTVFKKDSILRVGLNAYRNDLGIRKDGSMDYGLQVRQLISKSPDLEDYRYNATFSRIRRGISRFQYGDTAYRNSFEALDNFLGYCKQNAIMVIGFLPPFADSVYNEMKHTGKYRYIDEIFVNANPLFDKYGYELYDFSQMSTIGSGDDETIDGFHGGELAYLKLLLEMLDRNSALNNVCDSRKLRNDANTAVNNYVVYH